MNLLTASGSFFGLIPKSWEFALSLTILLVGLLIALILRISLKHLLPRLARITKTELDDKIMAVASKPLSWAAFFVALLLAFRALPDRYTTDDFFYVIDHGIFVLIVIQLLIAGLKINRTFFDHIAKEAQNRLEDEHGKVTLIREFYPLFRKLVSVLLFTLAAIAILKAFNQDIYSLITALGVGSLAIGLAAQDTLANMFAGFTLLIDRQVKPGDRIRLPDGTVADVLDIGLRSTKLLNFEKNVMIIPNKTLVSERVINYCYPSELMRGKVEVGVAYGSDIKRVLEIMIEEAARLEDSVDDPAPWAYLKQFGASSLDCVVHFYTSRYNNTFTMENELKLAIYERFEKEGINIPFPITTLNTEEPIRVELLEGKSDDTTK